MDALDRQAEGAPAIRVGIVQPNVPVGAVSAGDRMHRLLGPSARAEAAGAELVVWPEAGAYPYRVQRPLRHDRMLGPGRVQIGHRLPVLFGANTREAGERFGYNTAYLMADSGEVLSRYDKVNLVPLGEYIPLIDPDVIHRWIPEISHLLAGAGPARFVLERDSGRREAGGRTEGEAGTVPDDAIGIAPLICYEDILPDFVRASATQAGGVELFANLTIDAWYGDSAEPWEHLALAAFRSVEHRVPMVRSVSTGVSAVIDHNGRTVGRIPLRPVAVRTLDEYPPELLVEDVVLPRNTAEAPTPYARGGWLFGPACVLGVAVVAVRAALGARRRDGAGGAAAAEAGASGSQSRSSRARSRPRRDSAL